MLLRCVNPVWSPTNSWRNNTSLMLGILSNNLVDLWNSFVRSDSICCFKIFVCYIYTILPYAFLNVWNPQEVALCDDMTSHKMAGSLKALCLLNQVSVNGIEKLIGLTNNYQESVQHSKTPLREQCWVQDMLPYLALSNFQIPSMSCSISSAWGPLWDCLLSPHAESAGREWSHWLNWLATLQ